MNIEFNKYFHLSALSEQEQQFVIAAITDLVLARLADTIGDHLSDDEITALEKVSASSDPQAVIKWLNENIPNFSDGLNEILAEESADIAQKVTAITNYVIDPR